MLKTIGKQTDSRTHYFADASTYTFLKKGKEAKEVLELPDHVKESKDLVCDIVKQLQVTREGKKDVTTIKHYAVALLGSTNDNAPAYMIEVDYKATTKKTKEEEEEKKKKEEEEAERLKGLGQ